MSAFGEQGSSERQGSFTRRSKAGLETPLQGRFYGEAKRLVFAPPLWYDALVVLCIGGGAFAFVTQMMAEGMGIWALTGLLVSLAGIWGGISNERMICDLRSRRYARLEGQGFKMHVARGSLDDLEALVLAAEQYPHGLGIGVPVIYRLVLHWKGQREPLLVIEREMRNLPYSVPVSQGAQKILQRGMRYAQALKVKYYDNSSVLTGSPVPYM